MSKSQQKLSLIKGQQNISPKIRKEMRTKRYLIEIIKFMTKERKSFKFPGFY